MPLSVQILFFLSGWTGLVYEVAWAKILALTLGSSAAAHTFILSAFLGGMAAGYALIGNRAEHDPAPLKLYARLELAVAILGGLSPFLLGSKAGLALIPIAAALMGGTLPALARGADAVPRLYFLNSMGASFGSLCAAFVLVPGFGLNGSCFIAAGVNVAIAAAAWLIPLPARPAPTLALPTAQSSAWIFYAAAAASGFVSLALETAWIRLLALVFGSTVYSFAVMLAAFISGVGTGAWLCETEAIKRHSPLRVLGAINLVSAGLLLISLPLYERLVFLPIWFDLLVPDKRGYFLFYEGIKFLACSNLMFIPAACFGMVPPLAARAAAERGAASIGTVFAWNSIGNVLGAALAGLWLLPAVGLHGLFLAAVGAQALLAVLIIVADVELPRRRLLATSFTLCVAAALWATPRWNGLQMSFGGFRNTIKEVRSYSGYQEALKRFRLLYLKDGREATVSVIEWGKGKRALKVNGKADASTTGDLRTQSLLAQIPLLLHDNPKTALIIGLGSGITVGSALTHDLSKIDLVELCPEVVEADRWFKDFNGNALSDPRVGIHIEDARSYLINAKKSWDVVISEPSNPWMAGVGSLYTAEYYSHIRRRLNPGGLMAQWFHFYEMNAGTFRLVLRTFSSSFPNASVWLLQSGDVLLLGSESPIRVDPKQIAARMSQPRPISALKDAEIASPAALLSLQITSNSGLLRLAGVGPLNLDRFPRLEYAAPKGFFSRRRTEILLNADEGGLEDSGELLLPRYLKRRGKPLSPAEFAEIEAYHSGYRTPMRSLLAEAWLRRHPSDPAAWIARAHARYDAGEKDAAQLIIAQALNRFPNHPGLIEKAAGLAEESFVRLGDKEAAKAALIFLSRLKPSIEINRRRASIQKNLGDFERAAESLEAAGRLAERTGAVPADEIWMELAELALERNRGGLVVDALERALKANPKNPDALDLKEILLKQYGDKPSP